LREHFSTIELSDPRFESEGLRHVTVYSKNLHRRGDITFFVPSIRPRVEIKGLLILLHGVHGSHWAWAQKAGVHRTAQQLMDAGEIKPLAIAMPSDGLWGQGSGYVARSAENAERWIMEDVPVAATLAVNDLTDAPKLFLAGFSMGGYGALRLGTKYADRFTGISAHSAITKISRMQAFVDMPMGSYTKHGSAKDLDVRYWMNSRQSSLPAIRFDCGLEDGLLEDNRRLHTSLTKANISHVYEEFAGGHEWAYWEKHVEQTLRFVSQFLE
jgi:enterochelin esterase-like enzyme